VIDSTKTSLRLWSI